MSDKSSRNRFTWSELVSNFGIVNADELTEREKSYLLTNTNAWVCQFGKQYVTEKRSLFLSSICGPDSHIKTQ